MGVGGGGGEERARGNRADLKIIENAERSRKRAFTHVVRILCKQERRRASTPARRRKCLVIKRATSVGETIP